MQTQLVTGPKKRPIRANKILTIPDDEPRLVQKHFKDECDINNILNRFTETGLVTHLAKSDGEYGYASSQSFTQAMQIVANANSEFAQLPSEVRAHFNNSTSEFLDAAQDKDRREEFVKLGLLEPLPEAKTPSAPSKEPTTAPEVSKDNLVPPATA